MRTTIELSDGVAKAARAVARERNTTLCALVEEGLRLVVERHAAPSAYVLPDLSYGSGGLVDGDLRPDLGPRLRRPDVIAVERGLLAYFSATLPLRSGRERL